MQSSCTQSPEAQAASKPHYSLNKRVLLFISVLKHTFKTVICCLRDVKL